MFEENPFELTPANFFAISCDCHYLSKKKFIPSFSTHSLPNTSSLCHEYSFAQMAMGWHEEGIGIQIDIDQPYTHSNFPDVEKGDSVELMIDTRDLKSAGFNTRFCHHFYFLPKTIDDNQYGEITRFRTEDSHTLCDPGLLRCDVSFSRNGYKMKIFIPSQCLYGYDPKQFDRLGFTYRINRRNGKPQHFSVVTHEFQVDQQPSLWASIKLV